MIEIRVVPESLMVLSDVQRMVKLLSRVNYTERPMRWELRELSGDIGFAAVLQ